MSGPTSDPITNPQLIDKRTKPPGLLPRNTQALVLGVVAFVMVVVIALSGKNAPKEKTAATSQQVATLDPSSARIREYQNRIDEQARKLQMEQAELAHTQQALGMPPASLAGASGTMPYSNQSYPAYPRAGELRDATAEPNPEEASIRADMKKREYRSLYASNMALSYRKEVANPSALRGSQVAAPTAMPLYYPTPPPLPTELTPLASRPAGSPSISAEEQTVRETVAGAQEKAEGGEKIITKAKQEPELTLADGKSYRLFEGAVLETVLTNRLDGSFSGPVNCLMTTNVYSHNGQRLLIPQGSRVLGEVRKVETFGQQRLAVFFHRLIMPDGYSVSLDKFQGLNQIGETGLVDQVNHHYMQVFGVSIGIGAIAGLSQANTRYGIDESAADAYRQGVAGSLSQSSVRILDRYLNVLPTFTIREGHRVKVYLSNDLLLPAYEKHQLPPDL